MYGGDDMDGYEMLYQDIVTTCRTFGIPEDVGDDVFYGYVEFVREEINKRINGKVANPINSEELIRIVMAGLVNKYAVE